MLVRFESFFCLNKRVNQSLFSRAPSPKNARRRSCLSRLTEEIFFCSRVFVAVASEFCPFYADKGQRIRLPVVSTVAELTFELFAVVGVVASEMLA